MIRAKTLFLAAAAMALLAVPAFAAEVVPLAHFDGVGLRGGGHVTLKYGTEQRVTLIKGSTQFTRLHVEQGGGLSIDACDNNCPDHYQLEIEIVSPEISAIAIEGGGTIVAQGSFPAPARLDVAVNGGGDIDARALTARAIDAAVNGGGKIRVASNGAINAAVSGGGDIVYSGKATVTQAVSGGGSVSRAE